MNFRWFILFSVAAYGYYRQGFTGMLISLFILGFGCFLVYTLFDMGNSLGNFMSRPQHHTHVYPPAAAVYKDGLPGHPDVEGTARRNPDPTGPDDFDEFAGMITTRIHRNGG